MAIEKTVKINVESNIDETTKKVEGLDDSVKDLGKTVSKNSKAGFDDLGKSADSSKKSVGGLSIGFKGLGTAIKATGIGLLVSLLAGLVDALSENERAAKFFKVATEAVSIVMQDFINFLIDNSGSVVDFFKAIFEDPLGSIEKLGELIQANLIERFNSLIDAAGALGSAFKNLFAGEFDKALDDLGEFGSELIDVTTGVDNTFGKVVDGVNSAVESITEYGSKVLDTAQKNVELAKSAEIAAAQQALLVEQYDRQAEKLRQIRDNDLKSIDSRIEANNELLEVLDKQEKAMLAEADAILASAQAQATKNNNTENQVALLEAQANREGVLAQIEGFRSEQEANRIALIKERQELDQSGAEADEQRELRRKEFEASREEDALKRLDLERTILEEERVIEEERLQLKIDSFEAGTQARLDAENELKDRLQEIDQAITLNADEQTKARTEISEKEAQAKKDNLDKTASVLDNFAKIAGEQTAAGKTLAIASSTINTFRGVSDALAATTVTPFETALKFANAAAIGIAGAANVKDILKVKVPGGGGGGSVPTSSVSGGGQAQQAPAFNLVGASGVNQVQESLQEEAQPIQAFVVSSDVTTAQSLERNAVNSASIG